MLFFSDEEYILVLIPNYCFCPKAVGHPLKIRNFNFQFFFPQFDLDDIFGSKYTQTALFNTSLDPNSGVNSTETQTMLMSYDLVNMETQTMSMLDF